MTLTREQELLAILQATEDMLRETSPSKRRVDKMNMIPVLNSSIVKTVGYDPANCILRVQLDTGRLYEYYQVPFDVFSNFLSATSKGQYFNLNIKAKFNVKELPTTATTPVIDSGRQQIHALLDRSFNETINGKSFIPKFIELILENPVTFS